MDNTKNVSNRNTDKDKFKEFIKFIKCKTDFTVDNDYYLRIYQVLEDKIRNEIKLVDININKMNIEDENNK